jgi:hypothetical protein
MQKILKMKLKEDCATGKPKSRWEKRHTEGRKD